MVYASTHCLLTIWRELTMGKREPQRNRACAFSHFRQGSASFVLQLCGLQCDHALSRVTQEYSERLTSLL